MLPQGRKPVPVLFDMGWFMVFFDGKLFVRLIMKTRSFAETDVFQPMLFLATPEANVSDD